MDEKLLLIEPFTDLGFDQLAEQAHDGKLKLAQVTSEAHMMKLGRPLSVLYLYSPRRTLMGISFQVRGSLRKLRRRPSATIRITQVCRDKIDQCNVDHRRYGPFGSTKAGLHLSNACQSGSFHRNLCRRICAAGLSKPRASRSSPICESVLKSNGRRRP